MRLSIGDVINEKTVTKVTEKSCWLDNKRHSWSTIDQFIQNKGKLQTAVNPDISIDWSDKNQVLDYYNSFKSWSFYISMGDVNSRLQTVLIEVINGLVYWNDEYWLPAPTSDSTGKFNSKNHVENGWYNVHLIRRNNSWFGNKTKYASNIFVIENSVNISPSIDQIRNLNPNCTEIYAYPYGKNFRVDYNHSGRNGLTISDIYISNFSNWFKEIYLCQRWGRKMQHTVLSDEIMHKIQFNENNISIEEELNQILRNSKYRIDDSEQWGEYTLNYIVISDEDCKKFFKVIENKLKSL